MRITSSGLVKILGDGQNDGFYLSNAYGQAAIFGGMYYNGSSWVRAASGSRLGAGMYVNTGGHIAFLKAPETSGTTATVTESLRITNAGNLLVGKSSAYGSGLTQVHAAGQYALDLATWSADANGPTIDFYKSRSATKGTMTVVQTGDVVGRLRFLGADGANGRTTAQITAEVDGAPGTNDMPGRLVFATTKDGASSPIQRAKIDSEGTFTVNRTDVYANHQWSSVHEGPNVNGDYGLYRHVGYISAGSSTAIVNLMRVRRHYWGMGHYKITLKQTYYSATPEATWFLNGHGRNNSSFTPNWGLTHYNNNSSHTTIGSGTLAVTAASNSSPGNDYATYTDVYATVSAYNHFIVVIEASGGAAFSTDITSISNDGYALH